MGTLTIRTTEEQDQIIEAVQNLLGESAVSKTLLRCVTEYQERTATLETKNRQLQEALHRVNELENLISHYLQSQQALMSAVPQPILVAPRTGKTIQRQDTDGHRRARKNLVELQKIFKPAP